MKKNIGKKKSDYANNQIGQYIILVFIIVCLFILVYTGRETSVFVNALIALSPLVWFLSKS